MKKSLITLAIVAFAACVQAATLTWGVTQVKSSSDKTQAGKEYLGLFFIVDTASEPAVTLDSITSMLDGGDAVGAAALATYSKNATDAGLITSSGNGNYAAGTVVNGFIVVLDSKLAQNAKNYFVTGVVQRTAGSSGAMSFSMGSMANQTYSSVGPVPEPATGALALAGIALLFRRRKA